MTLAKKNLLRRSAALFMATALLLVVLFSAFYVGQNQGHSCEEHNCPVCQQLEVCEQALQSMALSVVCTGILFLLVQNGRISKAPLHFFGCFSTLVSLKVKLSN